MNFQADGSIPAKASQTSIAREAVAQMFATTKTDMTEIEVGLWCNQIDDLGPEVMVRFVRFWTSGGGQGNFMRAPRIDDFRRRMDPNFVCVEDALAILRGEISRVGPYENPKITDQRLQVAVLEMGGWAKVCADMPDVSLDFETRRFADRFKTAWVQGEAAVLQGRVPAARLMGLVASPQQLGFTPQLDQIDDAAASVSGLTPSP